MPTLKRTQVIRRPRDEVFAFFSDAQNLEALTPAYLKFRMLTPTPIKMRAGTLIDYRLRMCGVPLTWRTRIAEFVPQVRFVDEQLRGPYALWRHLHEFHNVPAGTEMVDVIEYEVGWSLLGRLAHAAFVRRTLEDIFDFRHRRVEELFQPEPGTSNPQIFEVASSTLLPAGSRK